MINISKALQIDGWMSATELTWLAQRAQENLKILEVGSYKGRSARALGDNTAGVVYCVDPWNGIYYNDDNSINTDVNTNVFHDFQMNLQDLLDSYKVYACKKMFSEFSSSMKFDMIFLDGDHRFNEVKNDIYTACNLLVPNGLLAGHDYNMPNWPSVKIAVDSILAPVDSIDYIWYKRIP